MVLFIYAYIIYITWNHSAQQSFQIIIDILYSNFTGFSEYYLRIFDKWFKHVMHIKMHDYQ